MQRIDEDPTEVPASNPTDYTLSFRGSTASNTDLESFSSMDNSASTPFYEDFVVEEPYDSDAETQPLRVPYSPSESDDHASDDFLDSLLNQCLTNRSE